jgi:hypothetical protein
MAAKEAHLAAARNFWPKFADVGCGFTRSLVRMKGCDPSRTLKLSVYSVAEPFLGHARLVCAKAG